MMMMKIYHLPKMKESTEETDQRIYQSDQSKNERNLNFFSMQKFKYVFFASFFSPDKNQTGRQIVSDDDDDEKF